MSDDEFDGNVFFSIIQPAPSPDFEDKEITCIECSEHFIWTAGAQTFYRDRNLNNPPKRCKDCKRAKNERITAIERARARGIKQKLKVALNCADCGVYTTVSFFPSQGRPVYCRECYVKRNPHLLNGEKIPDEFSRRRERLASFQDPAQPAEGSRG